MAGRPEGPGRSWRAEARSGPPGRGTGGETRRAIEAGSQAPEHPALGLGALVSQVIPRARPRGDCENGRVNCEVSLTDELASEARSPERDPPGSGNFSYGWNQPDQSFTLPKVKLRSRERHASLGSARDERS